MWTHNEESKEYLRREIEILTRTISDLRAALHLAEKTIIGLSAQIVTIDASAVISPEIPASANDRGAGCD